MVLPLKERSSKKESTLFPSIAILIFSNNEEQFSASSLLNVILISESFLFKPAPGLNVSIFGNKTSLEEMLSAASSPFPIASIDVNTAFSGESVLIESLQYSTPFFVTFISPSFTKSAGTTL